jgi:mono/diheme cytochrome c family protein/glucose/arabinose dehydrogenase
MRRTFVGVAAAGVFACLTVLAQSPQSPAQGGRGGVGGDPLAAGDFLKRPPVVRLSPEQEQALFLLHDGYHIEPVLADPLIQDPVSVSFDGNGRMYVIEMRSYMQDISGTNARAPISIISRHEDTDGDGVYDQHTVFADKLVLPRIAFPLDDGVLLVLETDNRDLYKYTDTNGDGVADKRELFYSGAGRVTNMEWQPSGLTWALDNWIYTTYNPYRLRIAPGGKLLREETEPNGGQWGASQDNYGKLWFVDAGGETGPVNFQAPIAYGAFNLPDNFEPDFQVPWPAPGGLSDMQGGMSRVRMPDGTLNHFTAAAGPDIFRGHRLPPDLVGDLLFTEPVGRIVRRAKVVVTDGVTQLRNAYPKSEFIRSTDPLFRPVNVHTAPDGTLYVVDMYTGIIQDAAFVFTYLQKKVEQYQLDRQHNWGRIWRITYDGMAPDRTPPRMFSETAAELVTHLDHPNGWWRDTAQKLLVLRQDKSVVPALRTMAQSSGNQLARIHALWTLEGLGSLDAPLARELMKSPDAAIRIQAIRASESLYKAGDKSFAADYRAMGKDGDPNVVIQAMLTLNLQRVPDAAALVRSTVDASQSRGVKLIGEQMLQPGRGQGQSASLGDPGAGYVTMSLADRRIAARGESTYRELCFTCHGSDGKGAPMAGATDGTTLAPSLAGSARVAGHRDYVIRVLLNGLSGPLDGKRFGGEGVMIPMGANSDEWIADVASYIRNSFGNTAQIVTPEQVAAVRKVSTRKTTWTMSEIEAVLPKLLTPQATWKMTASHNPDAAGNPIAATSRWDTGTPQQPDMWFQIELPQVTAISEIQLDASIPSRNGVGGLPPGFGLAPAVPSAQGGQAAQSAQPASPAAPRGVGAPGEGRGRGLGGFAFGPPAAGPVAYRLQVSNDGTSWGPPIAQGSGGTPTTTITFRPVQTRFLRITQTGTAARNERWAIQQIRVYQPGR